MKRFALVLGLIVATTIVFAKPIAKLQDNAAHYTQTENGYVIKFDLAATSLEYKEVMDKSEALSEKLEFVGVENGINNYSCILTINHQNHPEYVHKMMLSLGINTLVFKNNTYPMSKIIDILNSYQE